jgi:hypothetical protein
VLEVLPMSQARPEARCVTIDRPLVPIAKFSGEVGNWLCIVGFLGIGVAVTMAPFFLL